MFALDFKCYALRGAICYVYVSLDYIWFVTPDGSRTSLEPPTTSTTRFPTAAYPCSTRSWRRTASRCSTSYYDAASVAAASVCRRRCPSRRRRRRSRDRVSAAAPRDPSHLRGFVSPLRYQYLVDPTRMNPRPFVYRAYSAEPPRRCPTARPMTRRRATAGALMKFSWNIGPSSQIVPPRCRTRAGSTPARWPPRAARTR